MASTTSSSIRRISSNTSLIKSCALSLGITISGGGVLALYESGTNHNKDNNTQNHIHNEEETNQHQEPQKKHPCKQQQQQYWNSVILKRSSSLNHKKHELIQSLPKFRFLDHIHDRCHCEQVALANPSTSSSTSTSTSTSTSIKSTKNSETRTVPKPKSIDSKYVKKMLRRRQTMIRMNEESSKELLESRYNINWDEGPLGEGAFSTVHLATAKHQGSYNNGHNNDNVNKVAIKKINKKGTDRECFQREMTALLDIRKWGGHPNICALQEHFDLDDHYCLILDFIGGGEMFDHLMNNGAYSEADAARLVREVASALAFLHGIGVVHADLKPENLMLSTPNRGDAVVKLVDFGSAEIVRNHHPNDHGDESMTHTPAYCPPESFIRKSTGKRERPKPSHDMWALGLILYIMLTGVHPYDLTGDSPDEHVEARITTPERYQVPLSKDSIYTSHLSDSAIDLISKLIDRDPHTRLTAQDMLNHPWVRGETATTHVIAGSDERLNKLKFKMQRKFFVDVLNWSDDDEETRQRKSLIERSFQSFNTDKHIMFDWEEDNSNNSDNFQAQHTATINTTEEETKTAKTVPDKDTNTEDGGPNLTMSDFSILLSENIKSQHFPKGHIIYNEGDTGDHMYFINSGQIRVTTKDGSIATRSQGDFFGEGALLNPENTRSATVQCNSPVHAMQIPREYFDKYIAESPESNILLTLREKDKIRKRNRAKAILSLQNNLQAIEVNKNDYLFQFGEKGDSLYIVEKGKVDILVQDNLVFSATPGNIFGEHSVLTEKPRNSSAMCVSEDGCIAQQLMASDFRKLVDVSPSVKVSLLDLCRRRDFKKSIVSKLKKEFPYQNPREAFNAANTDKHSELTLEAVAQILREMDPSYTDQEIEEIYNTLDLTKTGNVSYDEFKKVFIADIRTSSSI